MDATTLLRQQHDEAKELFEQFEQTDDPSERQRIAREAIRALRAHTAIEEEIFYPAVRAQDEEIEDDVREDLEEHHVVEVLLAELDGMSPDDQRFGAKFHVMTEIVEHHVEEEEDELFPEVQDELDEERLEELGDKMQARYQQLVDGG